MLAKEVTPSLIVRYLDQYVIGQEAAKKVLAVAVYSHYRKISLVQQAGNVAKSNVLLIGNSGTGKTLMCETLSRMLGVPFVTANATSLAQTQYVNQEIEAALLRLIDRAGGDIARAQLGIVFIDEIDKLKAGKGEARVTSGESVQHALLKIMEGAPVKFEDGRYIDTTNILFIAAGAFAGASCFSTATSPGRRENLSSVDTPCPCSRSATARTSSQVSASARASSSGLDSRRETSLVNRVPAPGLTWKRTP